MHRGRAWLGLALGAALLLPPPGTDSRERGFCGDWLRLDPGRKHEVLLQAERRESEAVTEPTRRAGLRAALRHKLDAECRNWSQLMAFEIRALVDGVLEPCTKTDAPARRSPRSE